MKHLNIFWITLTAMEIVPYSSVRPNDQMEATMQIFMLDNEGNETALRGQYNKAIASAISNLRSGREVKAVSRIPGRPHMYFRSGDTNVAWQGGIIYLQESASGGLTKYVACSSLIELSKKWVQSSPESWNEKVALFSGRQFANTRTKQRSEKKASKKIERGKGSLLDASYVKMANGSPCHFDLIGKVRLAW